jgi:hypothetical protein
MLSELKLAENKCVIGSRLSACDSLERALRTDIFSPLKLDVLCMLKLLTLLQFVVKFVHQ